MKMKVLYHDSCFDGAASAAVFSRFYREKVNPKAELSYEGLAHKANAGAIDDSVFTGDENAIVDFRYSQNPKLTWWFDHHQSAFQQPGDAEHFRADKSGKKFHDPARKSCTKYLAEIAAEKFGFDTQPLADLIYWAELIDGAQFQSPQMAVELAEPALRLMTVLEANRDPAFIPKVIADLQALPLHHLVSTPLIAEPLAPLLEKHQKAIEVVRRKAKLEKGVVFFDVADEGLDSINKFISYYLYPDARYTVWVGRSPNRAKVSIGSNPWRPELRTHDLSRIAERYGGGGHPVVAAMSFQPGELDRARKAAQEILTELRG
jgi:nanoRNase/pAp phosphatase (c-di-AMP/oligoRNAs hydrolase)